MNNEVKCLLNVPRFGIRGIPKGYEQAMKKKNANPNTMFAVAVGCTEPGFHTLHGFPYQ